MAINLVSNSGKVNYNLKELLCDTFGDLPVDDIAIGSKAYVIDEKKYYILNSMFQWIECSNCCMEV